ncbi:hypothetical protein SB00610_04944 [Klebsiella quasipneumoniae subsp. similipneumoniae]|nr:hypothetical protein SB00610_04944 [Klebsiella quasipneumoniae subsp. similipneumoniae]
MVDGAAQRKGFIPDLNELNIRVAFHRQRQVCDGGIGTKQHRHPNDHSRAQRSMRKSSHKYS